MTRVAEARLPARPTSAGQKARYRRILQAAAEHGARFGLDHLQMVDVAKDADVAIATLYRYFPSKAILFTELMRSQVKRMQSVSLPGIAQLPAWQRVAMFLQRASNQLMQRPLLASAMLQSNNATLASETPGIAVTGLFAEVVIESCQLASPNELDRRLLRLMEQTWYGILISLLNGYIDETAAQKDTFLACELLLRDLSVSRPS